MYYYTGPIEDGDLFLIQIFILSLIAGAVGGFKYGVLTFVVLTVCSFIPIISSLIRYLLTGLYGGIGYLIGLNDNLFFMIFFILIGLVIGYIINFVDFKSL